MEANNIRNLLEVCRLCLVPKATVVDLFEFSGGTNHCWADVLNYVLDVKVMQRENLPSKACMTCIGKVKFAVPFKNMCLKSNAQLRGMLLEEADFTISNGVCKASEKSVPVEIKSENDEVSKNVHESIKIAGNACRLCLKADYSTLDLFKNAPAQDVILNDILSFSLGIKAFEADGFPQSICSMCAGKLYVLNNFKKQFLDSSRILFLPLLPKEEEKEDDVKPATTHDPPEENSVSSSCNDLTYISPPVADINLQLCLKCNKVNCNINHDQIADVQLTVERMEGSGDSTAVHRSLPWAVQNLENTKIASKTDPNKLCSKFADGKWKGRTSYRCGLCGMLYITKAAAIAHALVHVNAEVVLFKDTVDEAYPCDMCDRVYKSLGSLATHKKTHREKKFCCALCPRKFHHKYNLKEHLQTHSTGMDHHCDRCSAKFRTRGGLRGHLKRHDSKLFLCDQCPLRFYGMQMLKRHMLSHSGEQPHSCEICFRRFSLKVNLKYHMRTHSGEKPYTCAHCLRSFSMKCSLGEHTKIHTGVLPYPCRSCGKAFKSVSAMHKHEKIHDKGGTKVR